MGIHDDFFALGGHSLLAVRLISRVREAMQIDLPLAKVFTSPTIEELALDIEETMMAALENLAEEELGPPSEERAERKER